MLSRLQCSVDDQLDQSGVDGLAQRSGPLDPLGRGPAQRTSPTPLAAPDRFRELDHGLIHRVPLEPTDDTVSTTYIMGSVDTCPGRRKRTLSIADPRAMI